MQEWLDEQVVQTLPQQADRWCLGVQGLPLLSQLNLVAEPVTCHFCKADCVLRVQCASCDLSMHRRCCDSWLAAQQLAQATSLCPSCRKPWEEKKPLSYSIDKADAARKKSRSAAAAGADEEEDEDEEDEEEQEEEEEEEEGALNREISFVDILN